jgi:hypothetical protein
MGRLATKTTREVAYWRLAPAQSALSVQEYLAKNGITIVPHPYSSYLAPYDFFLSFPFSLSLSRTQVNTEGKMIL